MYQSTTDCGTSSGGASNNFDYPWNPPHSKSSKKVVNIFQAARLNNNQRLIIELTEKFGFSIAEFSAKSSIPQRTVYNLLSGRCQKPHDATFYKLFHFYCRAIYSEVTYL